MTQRLARILDKMTLEERREVEDFAAFLLLRDRLTPPFSTDDVSSAELVELASASGAYDWLAAEAEDAYSLDDGEPVRWPTAS